MNNEQAIRRLEDLQRLYLGNEKFTADIEAIGIAIEALEQQPSDDCISRQAVDGYITNLLSGYLYDEERTRLEDLSAFVWELPSVQPTRPTGKWIDIGNEGLVFKCSLCGLKKTIESHFCPNCGAKMEVTESADSN